MNLTLRYDLLRGTKYCQRKRITRSLLLLSTGLLAAVGTVVILDALIDPLVDARVNFIKYHNKERALKAEAQVKELEAILNGQVQMVEKTGKYGRVATIKWETVEFVKEKMK